MISRQKIAERTGEAVANDFFETFQKPGYAGSAFTWAKFPELCARIADSRVWMNIRTWDRLRLEQKEELRQIAKDSASKRAAELAKELA